MRSCTTLTHKKSFNMKKGIILLISLQLSIYSLFGQNITGKWYEIKSRNSSLEVSIDQNNDNYSGAFSWKWGNWINKINAPIDQVMINNDSLLFDITHAKTTYNFKLKKGGKTANYEGFVYNKTRQLGA